MATYLIFNSHSTRSPAPNVHEARERMARWIDTMRLARESGIEALRTVEDFDALPLTEEYTVGGWRLDSVVDFEKRRFLLRLATSSPILRDSPHHVDRMRGAEFTYYGQVVPDLGSAFLLDGLAASLLSDPIWDHPVLQLQRCELTQDGATSTDAVEVSHAARPEHLHHHQGWIAERQRQRIVSGQALWERRSEVFPSLDFCDECKTHIIAQGNNDMLAQLKRRLAELQNYCNAWQGGPPNFHHIPGTSPESSATLAEYPEKRTLMCSDGVSRLFSWHVKMTPDDWRIYFEAGSAPGRLFIGPVGPHLYTVRFH